MLFCMNHAPRIVAMIAQYPGLDAAGIAERLAARGYHPDVDTILSGLVDEKRIRLDAGGYHLAAANAATDEVGGPRGLEPVRFGDWESKGICVDF
ncbi:MAG: succinate dehydrogenase assembly factor 4 [Sphingomonadaceae bacterium]